MERSIMFEGQLFVAPDDCSINEWVGAVSSDPAMDEESIGFVRRLAEAFAAEGIE
jgi:hypothetical protein